MVKLNFTWILSGFSHKLGIAFIIYNLTWEFFEVNRKREWVKRGVQRQKNAKTKNRLTLNLNARFSSSLPGGSQIHRLNSTLPKGTLPGYNFMVVWNRVDDIWRSEVNIYYHRLIMEAHKQTWLGIWECLLGPRIRMELPKSPDRASFIHRVRKFNLFGTNLSNQFKHRYQSKRLVVFRVVIRSACSRLIDDIQFWFWLWSF